MSTFLSDHGANYYNVVLTLSLYYTRAINEKMQNPHDHGEQVLLVYCRDQENVHTIDSR